MKTLITSIVLLGISSFTFSQNKTSSVKEIIEKGKFAVVISEVDLKPGKAGPPRRSTGLYDSQLNTAPGASIQQMYAFETEKSVSGHSLFRIPTNGGSYFDYYGIDQRMPKATDGKVQSTVYLIQNENSVMVRNIEAPQTIFEILDTNVDSFSTDKYALKKKKYRNSQYFLTYQSTVKGDQTKLFLIVSDTGKATLHTPPGDYSKAHLTGFITPLQE